MIRHEAIEIILKNVEPSDLVLTTTGMISREAFYKNDRPANFYMIGSMGLLSALGLGLAHLKPDQRIVIIEGDGSVLMSLGNLPLIASEAPKNLVHIVLDNGAYESTGGQPAISKKISLNKIAQAAGYNFVKKISSIQELEDTMTEITGIQRLVFLHIKVEISSIKDLPRVSYSPEEITERFKSAVNSL